MNSTAPLPGQNSTQFTSSITHTLSCRWPILLLQSTAECCCWLSIRPTQLQRTICDQKFGSKLHFAWNQNKMQIYPNMLHFEHKIFKKFLRVIPPDPRCGRGDHLTHTPCSSSPQFDPHFQIPSRSMAQLQTIVNKAAWPFNRCYTVKVLQFLDLYDP